MCLPWCIQLCSGVGQCWRRRHFLLSTHHPHSNAGGALRHWPQLERCASHLYSSAETQARAALLNGATAGRDPHLHVCPKDHPRGGDQVTFHGCGFVDEEISVPDDGEVNREVSGLVAFVPVLQTAKGHISITKWRPAARKRTGGCLCPVPDPSLINPALSRWFKDEWTEK